MRTSRSLRWPAIFAIVFTFAMALTAEHYAGRTQAAPHFATGTKQKGEAMAEAQVRERVEDYARAVSAREIDKVMSLYAPDIASFDLNPPLGYMGVENKRRAWKEFFAAYTGPLSYEAHNVSVTADDQLAFVHSLNHVQGTLASGKSSDMWVRWTACLRRVNGVWLVEHDHVSVPADLKEGKAVLNLTP